MYLLIFFVFLFCSQNHDEFLQEDISKNIEQIDGENNQFKVKEFLFKHDISGNNNYNVVNENTISITKTNTIALNLKDFGVIGDGLTDDSDALQAAFDSGKNLYAETNSTFLISKLLKINAIGDQDINWNNSVVSSTSYLVQVFEIKKNTGRLKMHNLTINGNNFIAIGFWIHTVVDFNNIDVKGLKSDGITAYAYRYEVTEIENSQGNSTFDGCDCHEVSSVSNGNIGDSRGASRCLIFRWSHSGSTSIIKWVNSIFDGAWGDDGDLIHFEQMINNINNSKIIFDNLELKNFSRRGVKGLSGGIEFWNSTFSSTSQLDSKVLKTTSAGLVAMGNLLQEEAATGLKFINCTFNNGGYEGRLILNRQDGVEIRNCTFINTDIAFNQKLIGNVDICNNKFIEKSGIYDYGMDGFQPYFGTIRIGNNNQGLEGKIRLSSDVYIMVECN